MEIKNSPIAGDYPTLGEFDPPTATFAFGGPLAGLPSAGDKPQRYNPLSLSPLDSGPVSGVRGMLLIAGMTN